MKVGSKGSQRDLAPSHAGQLAGLRVGLKRERRFRRADLLAFREDQSARNAVE